jgi:hypothetical protein
MAIPDKWELPVSLRERIGKTIGRQRAIQEEDHTLIMVHQAPSAKEKGRKGACCWINPKGEFRFSPEGETFEHLFAGYRKKLTHLEHEYEHADSALKYFTVLEAIIPLHFAAVRMASALQMARDQIPTNRQVLLWRDESFEIQRESEILQVCTKNALDYYQAKSVEDLSEITYKLSKTSHKLNMMATLFVPMMAICGLFGMNVYSGLDSEKYFPLFWIIAIVSVILGLALNFFFRVPKKKEE